VTQNKSIDECEYETLKACTGNKKIQEPSPIILSASKNKNVHTRGLKRSGSRNEGRNSRRKSGETSDQKRANAKVQNVEKGVVLPTVKPMPKRKEESKFKIPSSCFPHEICGKADLDPSSKNDYKALFGPNGIIGLVEEEGDSNAGDPNMNHCYECSKGGDLICCDICPRSYHRKCMDSRQKDFPDNWICHYCIVDAKDQRDDVIVDYDKNLRSIAPAFSSLNDKVTETKPNRDTIAKIHKMLTLLIETEFGHLFREPVNMKDVPDYLDIIKKPMDLG